MGTSDSFAKINLICQICQRVRSVSESDLWSVRPCGRPWESNLWARPHRFESPIGLSPQSHVICLRGRARPLTASQIGLTDRTLKSVRPWESVRGRVGVRSASHAHRSDSTGRSNAFSREISQAAPRIGLHRRCAWEADRHLRLPRPHRSERPCAWAFSMYFCVWEAKFVRPWEAVRGCAPLIGSDRSHDKSERPWEAVRGPCSSHWLRDLWNICVFSTFLHSHMSL